MGRNRTGAVVLALAVGAATQLWVLQVLESGQPAEAGAVVRNLALVLGPAAVAVEAGRQRALRGSGPDGLEGGHRRRAVATAAMFCALLVPVLAAGRAVADPGAPRQTAPGAGYLLDAGGTGWGWGRATAGAARDAAVVLPGALLVLWCAGRAPARARGGAPDPPATPAPAPPPVPALSKRELLRFGAAGAAGIALGSAGLVVLPSRRASAAAAGAPTPWLSDTVELVVRDGVQTMIDGTPVYSWGWGFRSGGVDRRDALHVPGPVLWAYSGEPVRLSVHNSLDEDHSFVIDGVVDSGVLAPGQTRSLAFAAPAPGTYLYQDGLNRPVNRTLGLHGVLVVMPADRTLRASPALDARYWTFVTQWVWVFADIDPVWHARAQANSPIDPAELLATFRPRYFTLNGRTGSLAAHEETAPDTVVHDRIGNPALIRMVNAGVAMHGPHFHGNHVYPLLRNAALASPVLSKDTVRVMPEDRVDVLLPFEIPPNAVHHPPPASGRRLLQELHGTDMEGSWPMHCHVEMSQTAGGGLYPQGLLTDWKVQR